jgi:hypothetical protein
MSAIKTLVMEIEEQLIKEGRSRFDQEWISYELQVPLYFVEDVLRDMEQDEQYEREYQQEYADMMA